jgi:hypothetical protein
MKTNYHSLKIGCHRKKATIRDFEIRLPKGREKLYLKVCPKDGQELTVSEIWYKDENNKFVTQGLWVELDSNDQLYPTSSLARLLKFMGIDTIGELIGKDIFLKPKTNGFLCIETI